MNSYHVSMKTVVSERGQITIPKPIRERLGLRPGTALELDTEGGRLIGRKVIGQDVFRKWRGRGRLPEGKSVDQHLARARDAHRP
jgi:antitoxin PrlF